MHIKKAEVLILGGGPAGATAALRLLEKGIKPLIVEGQKFPRYHIGESMTGECGVIVRDLGLENEMIQAGFPVKHGVKVAGPAGRQDWWIPVMRRAEDGLHEQSTWQVRRSVFDKMLLDTAIERGADFIQGRAMEPVVDAAGVVQGAEVYADSRYRVVLRSELTLDCTGLATFLANKGVTGAKYLGAYDKQIAIFSQVADYERDRGDVPEDQPGNTHIYYAGKYHWAWAIPIDDEITSVGIVIPAQYFRDKKESREAFLKRELKELNPGLSERLPAGKLVHRARCIPNYSYQVRKFAGPGYICVGDAHRFVDPIFSFGLYVAVREAAMAADAVAAYFHGKGRDADNPFEDYMIAAEMGIDSLEDTIDFFWENPFAFAFLVNNRLREPAIDIFAGRIYEDQSHHDRNKALNAFRKVLKRERVYNKKGLFSVPIGSRFDPERAPLWNTALDSVKTTEAWIRDSALSCSKNPSMTTAFN